MPSKSVGALLRNGRFDTIADRGLNFQTSVRHSRLIGRSGLSKMRRMLHLMFVKKVLPMEVSTTARELASISL